MTLFFVLGTAAELIKVQPLIKAAGLKGWRYYVVSTGQSSTNFWRQYDSFGLPRQQAQTLLNSSHDLGHSGQAGKWFVKALFTQPFPLLAKADPKQQNWVIVHGDTLSTLVGSIWAKRLGWPLAHVEAGLRSANWWQPFPEEICRRLVSRLARLHFAPDQVAVENLKRMKGRVVNTQGNSLIDAVHLTDVQALQKSDKPLCLVNLHRFENLNSQKRWSALVETTLQAAARYRVIFVMHPQTEHKIAQSPLDRARLEAAGVELCPRMTFDAFISLVKQAEFLISDGGSNQEETYYLGVPCLLLRNATERREGLGSTAILSKFDPQIIQDFLANPQRFRRPPVVPTTSPTEIMLNILESYIYG
ncbi:MAG: UDP-N-acetyl glucosamine 2-epimerase [Bdellovibrionales bacterium]